jgi:hypothetical protein
MIWRPYTNVHDYQASTKTFRATPTCSLSPNQPASRACSRYPNLLGAWIGDELLVFGELDLWMSTPAVGWEIRGDEGVATWSALRNVRFLASGIPTCIVGLFRHEAGIYRSWRDGIRTVPTPSVRSFQLVISLQNTNFLRSSSVERLKNWEILMNRVSSSQFGRMWSVRTAFLMMTGASLRGMWVHWQ